MSYFFDDNGYYEEMEAEFNAKFDYIAELRAEHAEHPATLEAEQKAYDRYNAVIEAGGTEEEAEAAYYSA